MSGTNGISAPAIPFRDDPEVREWSVEELTEGAPRCTDAANADAFRARHGKGFRFVAAWDKWLAWDGRVWTYEGAALRVMDAALLSAREDHAIAKEKMAAIEEEARVARLEQEKDKVEELEARIKIQKALLKWHEQSQNSSRLNATIAVARAQSVVALVQLDANPWLLNVQNGTINLRTGDLQPHNSADLITQMCAIDWDDDAKCPTWDRFLARAMGGNTILGLYLQRLVGYALAGVIHEHVLLFFWGDGNNGKSTFLQTIQALFGTYGVAAPRDLLFAPKGGGTPHPSELARLRGMRLAVCAEIGENTKLDEAKVKDLTGGDTISCRRMNEDWWEYRPTHTLFIAGQHKPVISGVDLGIWRRVRLIPWTVIIPPAEVDRELPDKLLKELPGILRWAVNGCLEWQRIGLEEPEGVRAATAEYQSESDVLGEFFRDRCRVDGGGRVSVAHLREAYERWCKDAGHEPLGGRRLDSRLKAIGCSKLNVRDGTVTRRGWAGIRLLNQAEQFAESEPTSDSMHPEGWS